jgi:replicative DNA helicase
MTSQMRAVGVEPTAVECLVGSLMFSTITEVREILRHVTDDDVDFPASTVLASIRSLASRGVIPSPQLVGDDLHRRGKRTRQVAVWLASAVTSGACSSAARHYAGAVVAQSFRRQVESFGEALRTGSESAAETDVARLTEQAAVRITSVYARLRDLRGDTDD